MNKQILLILALALLFSCNKNGLTATDSTTGCTMQVCNDIFVQIHLTFTDKTGKTITVSNFSAVDQRTNMQLKPLNNLILPLPNSNEYILADDSMRGQLSTQGDDILVTATNPTTGQTKSVTFSISGGCSCHVAKLSGPDTIQFDQ